MPSDHDRRRAKAIRRHKRHERSRNREEAIYSFFDRIAEFLHNLFRPVRRLARKSSRATARMEDKSNERLARMAENAGRRRRRRKERREKRRQRADIFFAKTDEYILTPIEKFFAWLFRPVRRFFNRLGKMLRKTFARQIDRREKRRAARLAKLAPLEYPDDYSPAIERLRFVLMFFMCIYLLGFPGALGGFVKTVCGFVPIAFYILSGYLVLRESENRSERIVRAIKRSAVTFGVLCAVYFLLNVFLYRLEGINFLPAMALVRFWFNFIVMNVWQFDIGSAIWYVQALLYAYIIIYFLDKRKLLKYDGIISAVLILFTVVTGELSGIIKWELWGYTYIPGNFFTRALPYVLLGSYIRRNTRKSARINKFWFRFAIVIGIVLSLAEILILGALNKQGYYGHLIGMGVIAAAVCMLGFNGKESSGFEKKLGMSRKHINWIYYLCQPVSVLVVALLVYFGGNRIEALTGYVGIFTFFVCFHLAWIISRADRRLQMKKMKKTNE